LGFLTPPQQQEFSSFLQTVFSTPLAGFLKDKHFDTDKDGFVLQLVSNFESVLSLFTTTATP
jgi:hypothetical protein